jgi:methylated-DNA-[protein]-cysteine S-methyltransferase
MICSVQRVASYTLDVKLGSYCVFDTALGPCALAWREAVGGCAVTHLQLPESSAGLTEKRIARHSGAHRADPPGAIAALIERICNHLRGELQDFRDVPLDLAGVTAFARRVYETALSIPPGETHTYGEIARAIGRPNESRAVGQALARNPIPLIIPCHRVLAANGRLGGFSAPGARVTKARLLEIEGAKYPALLAFPP